MFKDMIEVTDKDIYQKVMASDTPAILIVTSPDNPRNQEFYEAIAKYIKLYGDKIGFYYLDTTKTILSKTLDSGQSLLYYVLQKLWKWTDMKIHPPTNNYKLL
jgi:hypothetical protein